jgi:hypothetical protein
MVPKFIVVWATTLLSPKFYDIYSAFLAEGFLIQATNFNQYGLLSVFQGSLVKKQHCQAKHRYREHICQKCHFCDRIY